jgi:nitroreductase
MKATLLDFARWYEYANTSHKWGRDKTAMMTPVMDVIRKRRSIRKYKPEQISEEELEMILEAGRFAPSGGNSQTSHFIVIRNRALLNELSGVVEATFAGMEPEETMYKGTVRVIELCKRGGYDFIYSAPTLVVAANKRGYTNALADCAVALENMMLAATSLDIGSCWINHLKWLTDDARIIAFMRKLGLGEDEQICGGVALGYPDQVYSTPLKRTGNTVTIIR